MLNWAQASKTCEKPAKQVFLMYPCFVCVCVCGGGGIFWHLTNEDILNLPCFLCQQADIESS